MNGSAGNTAHSAWEEAGRGEVVLNLATARNMVPLVKRIVDDILREQKQLTELQPEELRLHRQRHNLDWPSRSRRYQIQEQIVSSERNLQSAIAELSGLGVVLLDAAEGRIGFPTIVNGRTAFFSWRPGEDGVHYWHFPEHKARRPIPASWLKSANMSLSAKS